MADMTTIGASAVIDVVTNREHSVPQSRVEALLLQNTEAIKELADALGNIASIEIGDTSENYYDIGEYIIWQGKLYQTIREIHIGDTFVPDGNIEVVILGDEIEVINNTVEKIKMILGNIEDGISSSAAHPVGDLIVRNNKLYKVINTISAGGSFVEGNNIIETNLKNLIDGITGSIPVVTSSQNGLMSYTDKSKLDSIASGANKYIHPSYPARTGVPVSNQTPEFGGTFNVTQPVSDALGHITGMNVRTITMPNALATSLAAGLMSALDKAKLDGIASGAQANTVTGIKGNAESSYRGGNVNLTASDIGAATIADIVTAMNSVVNLLSTVEEVTYSSGGSNYKYYKFGKLIVAPLEATANGSSAAYPFSMNTPIRLLPETCTPFYVEMYPEEYSASAYGMAVFRLSNTSISYEHGLVANWVHGSSYSTSLAARLYGVAIYLTSE